MIDNLKSSKTLKEIVYALEPMSYYFGMKPDEFWECEYRFIDIFLQSNMTKIMDDFKLQITLQEATTDKLIKSNSLSVKRPKVIPLKKTFEKLFKEEPKIKFQPLDEQIRRLRAMKK